MKKHNKNILKCFDFILLFVVLSIAAVLVIRFFGLKIVMVIASVGTAMLWLWIILKFRSEGKLDFSKILASWLVINGTGMAWATYYLAYIGAEHIAEKLSHYVVLELLAAPAMYYIKAGIENISKNNNWPDKPPR